MKLQLALDDIKLDDALELVEKVRNYIDIIEIGTPFVIAEGMHAVRVMKERFPEKEILADLKIMDAGYYEAEEALQDGAHYVTVLGVTDILTVKGCVDAAERYQGKVVVDMICITDLQKRIQEMEEIGVHYVSVHVGADQQAAGYNPLEDLKIMKQHAKKAKVSVAGGINSKTINDYVALQPDIVIVGSGITHAEDPVKEAKFIYGKVKG
jgi:3-hexulose-6-phosphate synthase